MQRVINRNKHIEKNLCITLVIYQESLHDARSTKRKTSSSSSRIIEKFSAQHLHIAVIHDGPPSLLRRCLEEVSNPITENFHCTEVYEKGKAVP